MTKIAYTSLLIIITLRFTCGERKIYSTIKKFQNIMNLVAVTFQKYLNNNGTNVNGVETSADGLKKVEASVYYTYKTSEGNLMELDIQGIGSVLCDPKIATEDIVDIDDEF